MNTNQNIKNMKPYLPPLGGRQKYEGILLDFNERATSPGKKVMDSLTDFLTNGKLQSYPEYNDLDEKIAKYANVKPEEVMTVNGSDQGIDLIFRTFTSEGGKVVIPSPSFAMFYQCAGVIGNKVIAPEYTRDLSDEYSAFPLQEILDSIDEETELVVLCNPNNPTGTLISLKDIEKILKKGKKSIVFVDEAYAEFSGITATGLIKKYPNLIITRTFSKAFGLASLRIGYVLAQKKLLDEMNKIRGPYDVNMMAAYAAKTALADLKNTQNYIDEIMNKAKPLTENFFKENNIDFFPSGSNFLLFFPKNSDDYSKLKENGILTRPRNGVNIDGTIRVTIGTVKQMKKFINTYKS